MIVQKKVHTLQQPFVTEKGATLHQAPVGYEEYGNLAGPVVLVTHGGLQNQHAAGRYSAEDLLPGTWDDLIGNGKAIDTARYRVICANGLGSMFGTCGPPSTNPATGRRYGTSFPAITLADTARFYKQFLGDLGVSTLHLAIGPSMGGCQVLQLCALYPGFVQNAIAVAAAGRMTPEGMAFHHWMINMLRADPSFNGGDYEPEDMMRCLYLIHQAARLYYGHESGVKFAVWDIVPEGPDSQQARNEKAAAFLTDGLVPLLAGRDPNSYITLLNALNEYDLGIGAGSYEAGVQRIACPLMLVNFTTDSEFPPYWGEEVAKILNRKRPGQARAERVSSIYGHYGCLRETKKLAALVADFMKDKG